MSRRMLPEAQNQGQGSDDQKEKGKAKGKERVSLDHDPSEQLEVALHYLKSHNDTSRFVGLTILKYILDSNPEYQNPTVATKCWAAISERFLDRLLQAGQQSHLPADAQNLVVLGVGIIHSFMALMAVNSKFEADRKFTKRSRALMVALGISPPETSLQIVEIFHYLSASAKGAEELCAVKDWRPLLKLVLTETVAVLDIVERTFVKRVDKVSKLENFHTKFDDTFLALALAFRSSDNYNRYNFLKWLHNIVAQLPQTDLPSPPEWQDVVVSWLQDRLRAINAKLDFEEEVQSLLELIVQLIKTFPRSIPALLFRPSPRGTDSRNTSYFFVKLLLANIRLTLPSLQRSFQSSSTNSNISSVESAAKEDKIATTSLNEPHGASNMGSLSQPETSDSGSIDDSLQIATMYMIVYAFINFLTRILEDAEKIVYPLSSHKPQPKDPLINVSDKLTRLSILPPDLLLDVRDDIVQTISITIEFLYNRYHEVATSPVLQGGDEYGSKRSNGSASMASTTSSSSTTTTPSIARTVDEPYDYLTFTQLQLITVWLREDDTESLRKDAANIKDIIIYLYSTSDSYAMVCVLALECIITLPGVKATPFTSKIAELFIDRLKRITGTSRDMADESTAMTFLEWDSMHGTEVAHVLLSILLSEGFSVPLKTWMRVITIARGLPSLEDNAPPHYALMTAAIFQLVVELLDRAPLEIDKKKYAKAVRKIKITADEIRCSERTDGSTRLALEGVLEGIGKWMRKVGVSDEPPMSREGDS